MTLANLLGDGFFGPNRLSRTAKSPAQRKRPSKRRPSFEARVLALEPRCLMTVAEVPIPGNPVVNLSQIFWNGETNPINPSGKTGIPSPSASGATKTITLTNYSTTDTIYPF